MRTITYTLCLLLCLATACSVEQKENVAVRSSHPDGSIKEALYFGDEADTLREFYPSGKLKIQGLQIDSLRDGTWKSWYETGQQWSEKRYEMGLEIGKYVVYHPTGNVYIQGQYRQGEKKGSWYFYDQNGMLVKEVNFDEQD